MIRRLWHAFIVRVFPGTLEEYYAARDIHFRELKKYRFTAQHIIGLGFFTVPLFLLLFLGILPVGRWFLFVFPVIVGRQLISDATTEHLCLLLLRTQRKQLSTPETI
jgi:hypothetical protein